MLGLGSLDPQVTPPIREGKDVLFQTFGGVEAHPICVGTQEVEEFIEVVKAIAPTFVGINREDISVSRCFT